jgi:hypothetical protein
LKKERESVDWKSSTPILFEKFDAMNEGHCPAVISGRGRVYLESDTGYAGDFVFLKVPLKRISQVKF